MAEKKNDKPNGKGKKDRPVRMPEKTYWHLYSLQGLESEKLIQIVNKILKRDYMLIK